MKKNNDNFVPEGKVVSKLHQDAIPASVRSPGGQRFSLSRSSRFVWEVQSSFLHGRCHQILEA